MSDTRTTSQDRHVSAGPAGDTVTRFIRRRPLTSWFIWAFTVGQALAFIPAIGALNGVEFLGRPLVHQSFVCAASVVGLALPAFVITRIAEGPRAFRAYWRSAFAVGVSLRWYAFALVGVPVLTATLAVVLLGPPAPGAAIGAALLNGLLLQTVLTFLPNNWWEEVAWMGFVQRRLQDRSSGAVVAALLTGVLFALYHVSLVIGGGTTGALLLGILLVTALGFRMFMAWVFNRTGSLFLVGLVHAVSNGMAAGAGFGLGSGLVPTLYPDGGLVAALIHLMTYAILGVVLLFATRGRLGRRPRDTTTPGFGERS